MSNVSRKYKMTRSGKIGWLLVVVLILLMVGAGVAYWFINGRNSPNSDTPAKEKAITTAATPGPVEKMVAQWATAANCTEQQVLAEIAGLASACPEFEQKYKEPLAEIKSAKTTAALVKNALLGSLAEQWKKDGQLSPLSFVSEKRKGALKLLLSDDTTTIVDRRRWLRTLAVAFNDLRQTEVPSGLDTWAKFLLLGVSARGQKPEVIFTKDENVELPYFHENEAIFWSMFSRWLKSDDAKFALPKKDFERLYDGEDLIFDPARFKQNGVQDRIQDGLVAEQGKATKELVKEIKRVEELYSKLGKLMRLAAQMP